VTDRIVCRPVAPVRAKGPNVGNAVDRGGAWPRCAPSLGSDVKFAVPHFAAEHGAGVVGLLIAMGERQPKFVDQGARTGDAPSTNQKFASEGDARATPRWREHDPEPLAKFRESRPRTPPGSRPDTTFCSFGASSPGAKHFALVEQRIHQFRRVVRIHPSGGTRLFSSLGRNCVIGITCRKRLRGVLTITTMRPFRYPAVTKRSAPYSCLMPGLVDTSPMNTCPASAIPI
jgi:hypothetical protein